MQPVHILQFGMSSNYGGVESFIMMLNRGMDHDKICFDFLASYDQEEIAYEDEIRELGGRIYRVLVPKRKSLLESKQCLPHFFMQHPEIKGLHLHANFPYAEPLGYAKKAKIPVRILHSHNTRNVGNSNRGINFLRNKLIRYQINRYPSEYFACSSTAAKFMFPGKSYTWIKNGIDTNKFKFDESVRQRIRAKFDFSNEMPVVGFCGRLDGQKNPSFALSVFAEFKRYATNAKMIFIGKGEYLESLIKLAHELHVSDSVLFLGGDRSDVNELYQAMDLFLMPSEFEGLPIAAIEAQCAGLPCIVSEEAVPRETDLTGLVQFVSLTQSPSLWANILCDAFFDNSNRRIYVNKVRDAGFDMRDVALNMQNYYLSHVK